MRFRHSAGWRLMVRKERRSNKGSVKYSGLLASIDVAKLDSAVRVLFRTGASLDGAGKRATPEVEWNGVRDGEASGEPGSSSILRP